jgi:hypothetical protein
LAAGTASSQKSCCAMQPAVRQGGLTARESAHDTGRRWKGLSHNGSVNQGLRLVEVAGGLNRRVRNGRNAGALGSIQAPLRCVSRKPELA